MTASTSLAVSAVVETSSASAVGTGVLRRWGATMGGSQVVTEAQAIADAQAVDTLVGQPRTFAPYVAKMRAANPNLKLVYYLNGAYATGSGDTTLPEQWYAHDVSGARILSTDFSNLLMDPTQPGWIQSRVDDCSTTLASIGWDGCYLDMLGPGSLSPGYLSAVPINATTGAPWTAAAWIDATTALAARVSNALPGRYIVGNGLGTGSQYNTDSFGPTSKLLGGLAAGNAQGFVRGEGDLATDFRTEGKWKNDVDMLIDAGARSKSVLAMSKLWTTATDAEKRAAHRYALSTFLLGTNGSQFWYWSDTGSESAVVEDTSYEHVAIGTPIGTYAKVGGVYQRRFSGGLVAVNSTAAAVTIPLGSGQWTTFTGATVQGQLTLPAHSGEALTASQAWGSVPSTTSGSASSITPTSAVISATVNPHGLATTATVDFGADALVAQRSAAVAVGSGTVTTTTPILLTGLVPGTAYTYHVEATNAAGTTAGVDLTFTTPLPAPAVTTAGATALDPTSAAVQGTVDPNGLPTTYRFDYGLTTSYGSSTPAVSAGSGTTRTDVTASLTGLAIASVVHYRIQATNSTGTSYGSDRYLQMPKPPSAITRSATLGSGTATLSGAVNPNGTATRFSFQWGTSTSYGRSTSSVDAGAVAGSQTVTAAIGGLTAGVIYHYRIVASNPSGTTVGSDRYLKAA